MTIQFTEWNPEEKEPERRFGKWRDTQAASFDDWIETFLALYGREGDRVELAVTTETAREGKYRLYRWVRPGQECEVFALREKPENEKLEASQPALAKAGV